MDPFELTPAEQQRVMAETLRSQQVLGDAQRRGARYDNLAAIAPMVNNQAVVDAAQAAQASARASAKPIQLGQSGFMAGGQFAPNPAFLQENLEKRAQARGLQNERALQAAQLQQERLEAQRIQAEENRNLRRQLAADANANRILLAGMRNTDKADAEAEKKAAKVDKELGDQVFKLSNNLEKAGASEFGEAMTLVQETLGKYKPGTLPGFGRLGSLVPDVMSSDEIQMIRSNMQQAANILLKARSGAAVTNSEMQRFLREVAQGKGMSEAALRKGWDNVARTYGADLNNIMVGVSPEAVKLYEDRGGVDYRKRINIPKGRSTSGRVADAPPQGVTQAEWDVMTPEDRKLWQK